MKVLIREKNILEDYLPLEKGYYRHRFLSCLPSDSDGSYHVSNDDMAYLTASGTDLWDYPFVKINAYEWDGEEWIGINDKGIALIAIELSDSEEDINVHVAELPSYISVYQGRVQFIYRLKNFIPQSAREDFMGYYDGIVSKLANHLNGEMTATLINPFSDKVDSYIYNVQWNSVAEIRDSIRHLASLEHIKEVRGKGGKAAANVRKNKTAASILKAAIQLHEEKKPVNQTSVAKLSGINRSTVNRHWDVVMQSFSETINQPSPITSFGDFIKGACLNHEASVDQKVISGNDCHGDDS